MMFLTGGSSLFRSIEIRQVPKGGQAKASENGRIRTHSTTLSNNESLLHNDSIEFQVQMSWTFVNDSLCTTLCLQWEPEVRVFA